MRTATNQLTGPMYGARWDSGRCRPSLVSECLRDRDSRGGARRQQRHEGAKPVGDPANESQPEPGHLEVDLRTGGEVWVRQQVVRERDTEYEAHGDAHERD